MITIDKLSLPQFSQIDPRSIESQLSALLEQNRKDIQDLLNQDAPFTWANFMQPMDEISDRLSQFWSPIQHLHGVLETDALREAYNACLPKLTEYHTEIMQDTRIFEAIQAIASGPESPKFDSGQKRVLSNELRDFKLAGVHLAASEKEKFAELQQRLSLLCTRFSENLLDATQAFSLPITDETQIEGLPEAAKALAAENAQHKNLQGWLLTLDFPCYSAVMKFASHRETRRILYEAYVTRASELGPDAGKFDNSPIMEEILNIRHELANLVGFKNYAEYSLATKMAKSPERVMSFLKDLVEKSKQAGLQERKALEAFASVKGHQGNLEAWDLTYYSEKLRQSQYDISQEILKPYFPAPQVLNGMFSVVNKLYGIHIRARKDIDVWHPDVNYFEIFDDAQVFLGGFYTDLYARQHKRDGAWMDECRGRRKLIGGQMQYPVAYLTCNFTRPLGDAPALLNQEEVETLFHEFGHCLHHLLTKIDYADISGIQGVAWDAVEFPSQMMEHWCWDKETISLISKHVDTGETLPENLFKKMLAAKHFQSGLQMLRQLEFSLFDFQIHLYYVPKLGGRIQETLDQVRSEVAVFPASKMNRFQHSFAHIFAGSYAAGYYSYKWAEVLSSDAFSKFEEKGVFDRQTGLAYLKNILEVGGLRDPLDSFVAFRGREPQIDALLKHSGLVTEQPE